MKATGIVRRIDDLGRVVIPKEIRRTLRIREGDPLEIFVDREGEVILKKYSPIGELGDFAKEYADSLHEALGHIACIADRDTIIAVSGAPKKEFLNRPISTAVEKVMEERKAVIINNPGKDPYCKECLITEDGECKYSAEVIAPIISEGDPIGAVILASRENDLMMGELELKLAETAAGFLAKQMEQ
ncbi:AbrB family transcriptional regulator, stage V sporulation protein T [Desulfotomaculum arcticum]|uniref:AbrB family transcriptional regulator, stage V sporulation protein T n=1 Tax=Desulfotruncus arcticus DSM 17038 TaxID=1121424 RepID=A0A1I2WEJ8_9FIRM|nr:stage V sporulation protein T [Desulfotruncus arcticus]SFG99725.1 AbrB family transcriptional regulator, stage V sporulation protein T [Desulfotomaculum arcticum] [Desulfotruncus arcticus DSM 17038]